MLGDLFLQTNEVSLERVGGQNVVPDDLVEVWEEMERGYDVDKASKNEKGIPVSFITSKSVKMTLQVISFLVLNLLL